MGMSFSNEMIVKYSKSIQNLFSIVSQVGLPNMGSRYAFENGGHFRRGRDVSYLLLHKHLL